MICENTVEADRVVRKNGLDLEFIDITANTTNMKEFLALRDSRDEFANIKSEGKIGIPCFLLDDESITFDVYSLEGVTEKVDFAKEDDAPKMCGF